MVDAPWAEAHHGSLEALAASARDCELCRLVEELVLGFVARRPADERHRYACPEIKIARRPYHGDGFLVLLWLGSSRRLFLAATVGFCAESSE
jgi:hypothetical protein